MPAEPSLRLPPEVVPSDPESHLRFLYGTDFDGYLEVTTISSDDQIRTRSFASEDLRDAAAQIARASETENVFFAYGIQPDPTLKNRRGRAETASALPCLWFDLDHLDDSAPNAHSKSNLPESQAEALRFIETLPCPPTMVINSGHGLYPIWAFDDLWKLTTKEEHNRAAACSKGFQRMIKALGTKRGWNFDVTSDLARLTRAIGSVNWKGKPVPVEVVAFSGHRYRPGELEALTLETPSTRRPSVANDNAPPKEPNSDPDLVLSRCPWCAHCRDDAETLPEPEWKALCTIIGRCKDGRARFHELSRPHSEYDPTATDEKLDRSVAEGGPYRCDTIANDINNSYCGDCEFLGRVTSPIVLGLPSFDLFEGWVYVLEEEVFINLRTGQNLTKAQFDDAHRRVIADKTPANLIFNRSNVTTQVDRLAFKPNEPRFFKGRVRFLNKWSPSEVVPIAGDATTYTEHLAYLIPDPEERRALLDVFAFVVQNPGDRLGYMTLIHGHPGTGKSYLGDTLRRILGLGNSAVIRSEDLLGRWNDWVAHRALVIIEEMMTPGRLEVANSLKPMITQQFIRIEKKHAPSYEIENAAKFIGFTNHSVAAYVDQDDRRVFFLNSPAVARDRAYYDRLWEWSDENIGVIYRFLLDHDLRDFNPNSHAPMTEAKRQLIEDSRPPLDAELVEMIDQHVPPLHRDIVRSEDVREALGYRGGDVARVTVKKVGSALGRLGAVRLNQIQLQNGTRPRFWVIRNHDRWAVNISGSWLARDPDAIRLELLRNNHMQQA